VAGARGTSQVDGIICSAGWNPDSGRKLSAAEGQKAGKARTSGLDEHTRAHRGTRGHTGAHRHGDRQIDTGSAAALRERRRGATKRSFIAAYSLGCRHASKPWPVIRRIRIGTSNFRGAAASPDPSFLPDSCRALRQRDACAPKWTGPRGCRRGPSRSGFRTRCDVADKLNDDRMDEPIRL
jgi:hypothetical protein